MQKVFSMVVLAAFAAVAAIPAVTAEGNPSFDDLQTGVKSVGVVDISVNSKGMVLSWQGIELGGNLTHFLREKVDGMDGNDPDGVISQDEADSAVLLIKQFVKNEFDAYAHDERLTNHLLIDHENSQGAQVPDDGIQADGITGDVNSTEPITLSFIVNIGFPTHAADVHTVKLDIGQYYFNAVNESKAESMVGNFTLTVRGGNGWTIDAGSLDQNPACVADNYNSESGALVFGPEDVNCFTQRAGVILAFSITGHDAKSFGVPGLEAPLVALGMLGAGLALRRRL